MAAKPSEQSNFGPKSTVWLNSIGIYTLEDVEAVGVVEVYRRLKEAYPREVTLNMLYGLQAAVLGIPWQALTPDMKAELRAQVDNETLSDLPT
jgi:DNA transformation protein